MLSLGNISAAADRLRCEYIDTEKAQDHDPEEVGVRYPTSSRLAMEKTVDVEGLLYGIRSPARCCLLLKISLPEHLSTVSLPDNGGFCADPCE